MPRNKNKDVKIPTSVQSAAKIIAEIRGDDLNQLVAQWFQDYVNDHLDVLAEKAQSAIHIASTNSKPQEESLPPERPSRPRNPLIDDGLSL